MGERGWQVIATRRFFAGREIVDCRYTFPRWRNRSTFADGRKVGREFFDAIDTEQSVAGILCLINLFVGPPVLLHLDPSLSNLQLALSVHNL